jgi:hypothetical protein
MIFRRELLFIAFCHSQGLRTEIALTCTHLQLRFGDVNLAAINKLDDELEVSEGDLRRHDDDGMLAGILHEKLLKEC